MVSEREWQQPTVERSSREDARRAERDSHTELDSKRKNPRFKKQRVFNIFR